MDERRSLLLIGLYDETVRVLCMSRWMEICAPFRHLEKLRLEEKKEDKKKKKKKSNDSEQEEEEEEDHEDSASSFSSSLILVLREERVSTKEEEEEDQEVLNKEDRENEEEEEETTSKRVVLSRPKSSQGVKSRCRGVPASTQTSRQVSVDHEDEEEEGEHRFSQRERKKKDQRRKTDDPSQETSLPTVYRQLWVSRISESESEREEEVSVKEKREKKKMNRNKVGGRNEGKQKKNEEEEESEDREDGEDEGEEKEAPFTSTEESKKKKKERERDGEKDEDEKENFKGNGMSNQRKEEKKKQEKTLQISPAEKKKKVRYLRLPTKRDTSFLSISDHLQDVSRHFDTKIAGHSSLYERERRRASAFHERGGAREEADDLTAGRGGGLALLALSPCGRFLATKNERQPRVVYIWDLFRGILFSLLIHLSNVTHFSWSRHPLSSLSPLNACLGIVTDEKKFFLWTPRWQSIVSLSSPATPLSCVHPPSAISSSSSLVGCRRFVWSPGGTSFLLQAANDRAMVVLPHCLYTPPRGPSQLRRRRREPFNPFLSSSSSFLGPPDLLLPLYSSHSSHAFLGIETEEEEDSGKE